MQYWTYIFHIFINVAPSSIGLLFYCRLTVQTILLETLTFIHLRLMTKIYVFVNGVFHSISEITVDFFGEHHSECCDLSRPPTNPRQSQLYKTFFGEQLISPPSSLITAIPVVIRG